MRHRAHLKRAEFTRNSISNLALDAAINRAMRQMEEEIDNSRLGCLRREQFIVKRGHFRPDAGQSADRRKKGVERRRAHSERPQADAVIVKRRAAERCRRIGTY